jgi:hypothetical protein
MDPVGEPPFYVLPDRTKTLFQRDNILEILRVELPGCVTEGMMVEDVMTTTRFFPGKQ